MLIYKPQPTKGSIINGWSQTSSIQKRMSASLPQRIIASKPKTQTPTKARAKLLRVFRFNPPCPFGPLQPIRRSIRLRVVWFSGSHFSRQQRFGYRHFWSFIMNRPVQSFSLQGVHPLEPPLKKAEWSPQVPKAPSKRMAIKGSSVFRKPIP